MWTATARSAAPSLVAMGLWLNFRKTEQEEPEMPEDAGNVSSARAANKDWKMGDVVCFSHQPNGPAHRVTKIIDVYGGMVELDDMSGQFHAHLFVSYKGEPA